MKLAWTYSLPTLGLAVALFAGCGGNSKGGTDSGGGSGGSIVHQGGGAPANGGSANGGSTNGGSANGGSANGGGANGGSANGGSTNGGSANGGTSSSGGSEECDKTKCGPQLGLPNWTCADGSVGGPTGRCLQNPTGSCSWEINNCPRAGEGGASNQGGAANQGGAPNQGGQGNATGGSNSGFGGGAPCGVCAEGTTCVNQVGTRQFLCATQNPCGAAAACSCIVGQGTCQPNRMGIPPGYCSCDNGLD